MEEREEKKKTKLRVPDQIGISQACYIVEIYHSVVGSTCRKNSVSSRSFLCISAEFCVSRESKRSF